AGVEAINSTIQWVKKTARGFRNVEHFKTAIYFHCGGLDLYPHYFLKRHDNSGPAPQLLGRVT
ncbi:MAG: hypothetical protein CV088_07140, partial [Nitrospira sp. LK70]|nr:hypothetical protein [Nitrospira sp. LK70]